MLVVDASIAVKWFLNEQDSRQALGLFKQPFKLIAPDLIRIEVLAALAKAVRKQVLSAEDAELKAQQWRDLVARRGIFIAHSDGDYAQATTLALETNHALYDCLYLTYARNFHVPLATADKRLASIAREIGVECFSWKECTPDCED